MSEAVIKIKKSIANIRMENFSGRLIGKDGLDYEAYRSAVLKKEEVLIDKRELKELQDRLSMLEKELQQTREESFQAGFGEGKERTLAEANQRIKLAKIEMASFHLKYLEMIENMEEPLLRLAMSMAEKAIGIALERHEDIEGLLKEQIRKALIEIVDQNRVTIQVNPAYANRLKKADLAAELDLPAELDIQFIADRDIQPGEVVVSTDEQIVDATFRNQLQQMGDELQDGEL